MDTKKLADLLYPNAKPIDYWFKKYPKRNLPEGAEVTRFAPSPTGYLHIGGVYTARIDALIAKQGNTEYFKCTELIRENTEDEIEAIVWRARWL